MRLPSLRLGAGGEFDLLRAMFARLGAAASGLGDDCALLPIGGRTLAASIDLSLEGVHFRTDWLSFREIGWRATAAALSDLAAEGAQPIGVLVSLGIPGNRQRVSGNAPPGNASPAVQIMSGVGAATRSVGASVLGGDLVRSSRYLVDVCVLGVAQRPVRRSGARPGDGLWVTGRLGGAGLALAGVLSDGLAGDAEHLAAASGVRVEIDLERLPCWPGVAPLAAASSGEEYELLAALPRRFTEREARAFRRATGLPLTRIGACTAGHGLLITQNGRRITRPHGFDHFPAR